MACLSLVCVCPFLRNLHDRDLPVVGCEITENLERKEMRSEWMPDTNMYVPTCCYIYVSSKPAQKNNKIELCHSAPLIIQWTKPVTAEPLRCRRSSLNSKLTVIY